VALDAGLAGAAIAGDNDAALSARTGTALFKKRLTSLECDNMANLPNEYSLCNRTFDLILNQDYALTTSGGGQSCTFVFSRI
jgi:hypothetical protein